MSAEPEEEDSNNPLLEFIANMQIEDVVPQDELFRIYYRHALELTKGVVEGEHGAARMLGMTTEDLTYWLKKFGLK